MRDGRVTGVQTCALPILSLYVMRVGLSPTQVTQKPGKFCSFVSSHSHASKTNHTMLSAMPARSEERRVGEECKAGGWPSDSGRRVRGSGGVSDVWREIIC